MYGIIIWLACSSAVVAEGTKFPEGFKFGVATSAYQVEGGWNENGKGESIWDHLTHHEPSMVKDGSNGDIACDSYHRYTEDVESLKLLGVNFYRFSLSWPRLFPDGRVHKINEDGVNYYNNLIDELVSNCIEPVVTLYHWDLPQPLQDLGGWSNEVLAQYFEDYSNIAFALFGDRVKTWITFNEPSQVCGSAYGQGGDAPAYRYSGVADYMCGRTLLLAHASAYRVYDEMYRRTQRGKIGITVNAVWSEPKTNSTEDQEAAERHIQMDYGWWTHPILLGDYPEIMKSRIKDLSRLENFPRSRLPPFTKEEIMYINNTYDFLGLNHYSTWLVSNDEFPITAPISHDKDMGVKREQDPSWKSSSLNWLKVVPWGFRKLLNWIKDEYGNPLVYVTENGFADTGAFSDVDRINYHRDYLRAMLKAINEDGCNVGSYTAWSLMDNMEWREGYTAKFGLFQVDFDSANRTRSPKASAYFYQKVIKNRAV